MLEQNRIAVTEVVDARREKIDAEAAWQLLKGLKRITTAKGKKVQVWDPASDERSEILMAAMGPSGNLRAPALRVGDELVIGFSADFYAQWLRGGKG